MMNKIIDNLTIDKIIISDLEVRFHRSHISFFFQLLMYIIIWYNSCYFIYHTHESENFSLSFEFCFLSKYPLVTNLSIYKILRKIIVHYIYHKVLIILVICLRQTNVLSVLTILTNKYITVMFNAILISILFILIV